MKTKTITQSQIETTLLTASERTKDHAKAYLTISGFKANGAPRTFSNVVLIHKAGEAPQKNKKGTALKAIENGRFKQILIAGITTIEVPHQNTRYEIIG